MKEMLYEVRCLKSNEDMILALAGQFKQLSHEPGLMVKGSNPVKSPEFFRFMRQLLKLSSKCEDHILKSFHVKMKTSYSILFYSILNNNYPLVFETVSMANLSSFQSFGV